MLTSSYLVKWTVLGNSCHEACHAAKHWPARQALRGLARPLGLPRLGLLCLSEQKAIHERMVLKVRTALHDH
jgi:hypothetical protein